MTGSEWNEKIVAELDSQLNLWVSTIPDHCEYSSLPIRSWLLRVSSFFFLLFAVKWDPLNPHKSISVQSTILYVTYYWVQVLVHRPFISPTNEEAVLTYPSLTICANAARSAVRFSDMQRRRVAMLFPTVTVGVISLPEEPGLTFDMISARYLFVCGVYLFWFPSSLFC